MTAERTLIMMATLMINRMSDLIGYLDLLWHEEW
jgi:hypothetical protein